VPDRMAVLAALSAVVLAAAGCGPAESLPIGYFLRGDVRAMDLGRVVFVGLDAPLLDRPVAAETTEALYRAIQATSLFHVDVVPPDHPALAGVDVNRPGGLTLRDLSALRKALGCNALLVGSMTQFRAYPRMHMGLYLRLLDLRRGRLLWGVDHVWEATEQATAGRIRHFYRDVMHEGADTVESDLASFSPRAFQKFIAWEVARSLTTPNRPPPARAARPPSSPTTRPTPSPKSIRKL